MTYATDEASVQDSQPREGYEIIFPQITYRITSGEQNVVIQGATYTAEPAMRGDVVQSTITNKKELEITLPVNHAVVRRWIRGGIPPRRVVVIVRRKQLISGDGERIWAGSILSVSLSGNQAKFLIPSMLTENLGRRLPVITVSRNCPHILYDANCRVNKASFTNTAQVLTVQDKQFTAVMTPGYAENYAQFGSVLHVPSGESMDITYNTLASFANVVQFTMALPIYEMKVGDYLLISAGCPRTPDVCKTRFDNIANYGGFPFLPKRNPFVPNTSGVYEVK
jgi:hypothetical protein